MPVLFLSYIVIDVNFDAASDSWSSWSSSEEGPEQEQKISAIVSGALPSDLTVEADVLSYFHFCCIISVNALVSFLKEFKELREQIAVEIIKDVRKLTPTMTVADIKGHLGALVLFLFHLILQISLYSCYRRHNSISILIRRQSSFAAMELCHWWSSCSASKSSPTPNSRT